MALNAGSQLVLIVDDTPTNIGVLVGVLKQDAYRTKVATNGERALLIAAADERPDLILLDVEMPGLDGYEVCPNRARAVGPHSVSIGANRRP